MTIKGEWFTVKDKYYDFFLKVILNDGNEAYILNTSARVYVASQTPPLKE